MLTFLKQKGNNTMNKINPIKNKYDFVILFTYCINNKWYQFNKSYQMYLPFPSILIFLVMSTNITLILCFIQIVRLLFVYFDKTTTLKSKKELSNIEALSYAIIKLRSKKYESVVFIKKICLYQ